MAVELAVEIYKLTKGFPTEEKYGMIQQMRRSSVSISSNIAEGVGRSSNKEFKYFLNVAYGSSCELETQLIIANRTNLLDKNLSSKTIHEIGELQKRIFRR